MLRYLCCWLLGHRWLRHSLRRRSCDRCRRREVLFAWQGPRRVEGWIEYYDGVVVDLDGYDARIDRWDA